ncbi:hypothetical protein GUITHDRAFT_105143 [Guillardia theta CCMP2712]|uniref:Uncharacterized protein n=1 Tax=Guillardia theta (strain CCMP2712) TaxID=905079 RepID=L1JL43_GUITC|nr:hypothetical protein GUITHDRAFT_105143 [Guillardia theta CCMP2712]EKX49062.1 hypothetical protein GUITHDRAFT_105143 [Guillardia theta CCMP2712]|eukprot:XP_005836042.1 hypothetical protein GUITHDRAFT_105143 [Guillardia theta CCMP2712]
MQERAQRQERLTEHEVYSSGDHGDGDEDKHGREGGQYLSKDLLNRQVQYSSTDFKKAVYRIKTRLLKSLQDEHWIRNSVTKHLQASFENRGRSKELKDDSSILGNVEDVFAQFNLERAFSAASFKTHEDKKRAHSQVGESSASNEETSIARTGESEKSQQQEKSPREGYLVNIGLATTRSSWSPAALAAAFFEIATTPYQESAIGDLEVRQTSFAPLASGSLSQALMDYELPLWAKGPGKAMANDYPSIVKEKNGSKTVSARIWISNDEGKPFSETDRNVLIYAISKGLVLPLSDVSIRSVEIVIDQS